jgi:hypothetical protein
MRATTPLMAAGLFALMAGPAFAQTAPIARPGNQIGTNQSEPMSNNASNITATDTHTPYAPKLPAPSVGNDASPQAYLTAARQALVAGRTGEAQEALERAETRVLDRNVRPSLADQPSQQPLVAQIGRALAALASGDRQGSIKAIDAALQAPAG